MVTIRGLAAKHSPARAHIYQLLVADPQAEWSVKSLHAALPGEAGVSLDLVRASVYMLLGEGVLQLVKGCREITVCLAPQGKDALLRAFRRWSTAGHLPSKRPQA